MRALVVGILALLALSGLNGWLSRAAAGERVEIEMSVWGMPFENALYTREYIPQFERLNPGIRVRFHHFDNYGPRILLASAGGIAPDVMRQNTFSGVQYIRRGMNLALDRFIDGPDGIDRRDFIPVIWESLRYRGRTYGLPQDINLRGLYYNRDVFDRAHLKYPDETWTWKDLERVAEQLTIDRDGNGDPEIVGLLSAWKSTDWLPFYYQAGGQVWNASKTEPAFPNPAAVRSLEFLRRLKRNYLVTQSNSERGGLGPHTFFQNGKAAMLIDGTWRAPQLKKSAPGLRFGVAPLPGLERRVTLSSSCYWAVSARTRHPDSAWKLAKFLSDRDQLVRYWQYLWVAPPARWSALRSAGYGRVTGAGKDNPGIDSPAEFAEKCGWIRRSLEGGEATAEYIGPFTPQLNDRVNFALESVLLKGVDPGAALLQANRELRAAIRQAEKTFNQ